MSGKIYLIQDDDTLLEMSERPYANEDILQALLGKYPDLLAGEQMNSAEPRRWLLISREVGVPGEPDGPNRWSLDHVFLDQDGIPTLVEVKRSSDHRIRREVVGQLLDYAANAVVYWPLERLRADFEAACTTRGEVADTLVETLLAPDGEQQADIESFWAQVKTNLQAGKVRLVFVADIIPPELRRIVEFLNEQMSPAEVLAVELRQYVGQGLRTLVPQVVGQTAEAQQRKSSGQRPQRQWDEPSFFADFAERNGAEETAVARRILNWAKEHTTEIWWGKGMVDGSFVPVLVWGKDRHSLFAVYTYGRVEIYFQYYQYKKPFDSEALRHELRQKLNQIPGVHMAEDVIARRPSIPTTLLKDRGKLQQLLEIFDWIVTEIQAS